MRSFELMIQSGMVDKVHNQFCRLLITPTHGICEVSPNHGGGHSCHSHSPFIQRSFFSTEIWTMAKYSLFEIWNVANGLIDRPLNEDKSIVSLFLSLSLALFSSLSLSTCFIRLMWFSAINSKVRTFFPVIVAPFAIYFLLSLNRLHFYLNWSKMRKYDQALLIICGIWSK